MHTRDTTSGRPESVIPRAKVTKVTNSALLRKSEEGVIPDVLAAFARFLARSSVNKKGFLRGTRITWIPPRVKNNLDSCCPEGQE